MTMRILGAPLRYVQGPGAIDRLAEEIAIIGGGPAAVVIDPVARDLLGERISSQLPDARLMEFGGECTAAEIAARAREAGDARPQQKERRLQDAARPRAAESEQRIVDVDLKAGMPRVDDRH